jgi:hypothetical protein
VKLRCGTHGEERPATFTCIHVAEGGGVGFCLPPEADEPWPDAVCDACDAELRLAAWTEEIAAERIRAICNGCWEEAFARSGAFVPHATPKEWLHDSLHRGQLRQEQWIERHEINAHRHWQFDLDGEAPWLGFGESATRIHVKADALVIGSWSSVSNTWLWGWGNDDWEAHLTAPFVAVKRYGERHGIEALWRMGGSASESDAFGYAATALDLLPGIEGIYRAPTQGVSLFLAVRNTQRVS